MSYLKFLSKWWSVFMTTDKSVSQSAYTTSYRPIFLISQVMLSYCQHCIHSS